MKRITILSILLLFTTLAFADLAEQQQIIFQSNSPLSAVNFSNDGHALLFISSPANANQSIYQYDLRTKKQTKRFTLRPAQDHLQKILPQVFANKGELVFMGLDQKQQKGIYLYQHHQLTLIAQNNPHKNDYLSQGYLLSNGDIVYLVKKQNASHVYLYHPATKQYYNLVHSKHTGLFDAISYFSAKHHNIVFHGAVDNQKANYTYADKNSFLQLSPVYHDTHLGPTNYLQVGNKAYVVFVTGSDKLKSGLYKHYNLFGNILKDGYNLPLVTSGELSPHYMKPLYVIKRPVVDFYKGHFYFIFLASTVGAPQQFYLYAAIVEDEQVKLLPIFVNGKVGKYVIKDFYVGDIALSNYALAVTTKLSDHSYVVIYEKIAPSTSVSLASLQHSIQSQQNKKA